MMIESVTFETAYQNGPREIRVVRPDGPARRRRALYVLPVEAGGEQRYGDGLAVLAAMDAHNTHDLVLVQPLFERAPWYGDHATDPRVRQASYLREFVAPWVERTFGVEGGVTGRLLFGFSKSGWGAFSLILRYPEAFGYAASWDAPLLLRRSFSPAMSAVYGTQAQLDRSRPDLLIPAQAAHFRTRSRLVLAGECDWGRGGMPPPGGGSHTVEAHQLLERHGIAHHYNPALAAPHTWNRQWMAPVLAALMALAGSNASV